MFGIKAASIKFNAHNIESLINHSNSIELGKHGRITLLHHSGRTYTFNDGSSVKPGDIVGNIDITRRLDDLPDDVHGASQILIYDLASTFYHLSSELINGKFPKNIKALTGLSHLAGTQVAKLMGFEISEPETLERLVGMSIGISMGKSDSISLTTMKSKFRKIKRVWITPETIIQNKGLYNQLCQKLGNNINYKI